MAALLCLGLLQSKSAAAEPAWSAALGGMPLPADTPILARSNAMRIVLENFRSNAVVKAVVFLPSVADDFYLIHRDRPIDARPRHLAEAIEALTVHTPVRASFTNGMLLLHTDSDRLLPDVPAPAARAGFASRAHRVLWVDTHWRVVQPALRNALGRTVRPAGDSREAWHFERVNLAGHGLNDAELLHALALTTGTRIVAAGRRITFERPGR